MRNVQAEAIIIKNGGTLVISLLGDIDHHSAKRLRGEIDSALFLNRPKRATIDLSGVEFMDSSGLGLILGRLSRVSELGGKLTLQAPSQQVQRVLALAGVERLLEIK